MSTIAACGRRAPTAPTKLVSVIAIDFDGGGSALYPHRILAPLDLTAFRTADGGTLADHDAALKETIRDGVAGILSSLDGFDIIVVDARASSLPADTLVHVCQERPANGRPEIGRAEYDPCNRQHDNAAVIFAGQIADMGGSYTEQEWIHVFANVCAHEIAHTLGFGHIDRTNAETAREGIVELMLDGHTMGEMRGPQGFITARSTCPAGEGVEGTPEARNQQAAQRPKPPSY